MVRWNRTCKDQTTGKAAVLLPKKEKNAPQYRRESSFGYTITSRTIFCDWLGNRLIKLQLKPHFHLSRVLEDEFRQAKRLLKDLLYFFVAFRIILYFLRGRSS